MTADAMAVDRPAIDAPAIAASLTAVDAPTSTARRAAAATILKAALAEGRAHIAAQLAAEPGEGLRIAAAYAALIDQIVRLVHDFVAGQFPSANRTAGERLSLVALGGYGRSEMALHSDVDILFLSPDRRNAWVEVRIEAMLYLLWDLGLKLGQQSASVAEMLRLAADDMTVRTALIEARFVCGDAPVFADLAARFVVAATPREVRAFVTAKLAERNARHVRMGDSRYVVEPNVKEGKGALRDLHALLWIGKYAYRATRAPELVDRGLLTTAELRRFGDAERFFWAVRCHLHVAAGRAEDRLGFDAQRDIAAAMRFADRPGKSAVERFMQVYFRFAKTVGDLSGVFLAQLDETFAEKGGRFGFPDLLPAFLRTRSRLGGLLLDRGRLAAPDDGFFAADPVRLVQLFTTAAREGLEIHPRTMRAAARDARAIGPAVRADPAANAAFLDLLTGKHDPEPALRWMNEAGVLGRFVPDFARVVGQTQFDRYHHYTVDEHTIRAIGLLSRIEHGMLKDEHPLSTALFRQIASRRVLYVAVFLHDIAKGRGGDHSELGAAVAGTLGPRFGLTAAETELAAWLVRHHLLMSRMAFKRDLADPKTIADFAGIVKSPERLRLLLILTVVDICSVGPSTWNGWKRQLMRTLFDAAEEQLRRGHKQRGRSDTIAAAKADLRGALGWTDGTMTDYLGALPDTWWIAEGPGAQKLNALHLERSATDRRAAAIDCTVDADRGATLVTLAAPDRPGLFYKLVTAISAAGGNIIDARVYTGTDGRALDNILVQRLDGAPYDDRKHLDRLVQSVRGAIDGHVDPCVKLSARSPDVGSTAFAIEPAVLLDNQASNRYTVVEVNAAERPALLSDLALALWRSNAAIHSAHIATFGARAVDVFYLTDGDGAKIVDEAHLATLTKSLEEAARS